MKTTEKIMAFCFLSGASAMFAGVFIDKIFILVAVTFYFIGIMLDNTSKNIG